MKRWIYLTVIAGLVIFCREAGPAFAETEAAPREEAVYKQVEELQKLRQENPQAYRGAVQERKKRLAERLGRLREKQPEKYRRFLERGGGERRSRLEYFKTRHPEMFTNYKQRVLERMRRMARKNPERFQEFLKNHPQMRERLAHLRQERGGGPRMERLREMAGKNPERFREFLKNHPEAREKWAQEKVGVVRPETRERRQAVRGNASEGGRGPVAVRPQVGQQFRGFREGRGRERARLGREGGNLGVPPARRGEGNFQRAGGVRAREAVGRGRAAARGRGRR